jgi:hypothetical protein
MDGLELLQRGADAKRAVDLRLRHGGTDLGQLGLELGEREVAVGVDEHKETDENKAGGRQPCPSTIFPES